MTVVLGIGDGKTVTIGADSIAISPDNYAVTVRREPKVFFLGPHLVVGYSGSFAVGDAIRFGPAPPPPEGADPAAVLVDPEAYIHEVVIPHFRAVVEESGVAEGSFDGHQMLVGFAGRVFLVESLSQAGSSIDGIEACGAGDQLAIGAALALRDSGLTDEDLVLAALDVAERRSAGVRGPFRVVSLPAES